MTRPVSIRPLAPEHAESFRRLRLAALRAHPENFGASHDEESAKPVEDFAERLTATPHRVVLGAWIDDDLVGTVGIYQETRPKFTHRAGIWGMYVDPACRGRGVGQALLATALVFARHCPGVSHVFLRANAANRSAIALYARAGFVAYGTEPAALSIDGVLHEETMMACDLRASAALPDRL